MMLELLNFDDLIAQPPETLVPTPLEGCSLALSQATSNRSGTSAGPSIALKDVDFNACAGYSVNHVIRGLLVPGDMYPLPEDNLQAQSDTDRQTSLTEDVPEADCCSPRRVWWLQYPKITFISFAVAVLVLCCCCCCLRLRGAHLRRQQDLQGSRVEHAGPSTEEKTEIPPETLRVEAPI